MIYRTLQHITFAQTATAIAATMRQFVAMLSRGFEDGLAGFGDKGEISGWSVMLNPILSSDR